MNRNLLYLFLAAIFCLCCALPDATFAQTGSLSGEVREAESAAPLVGCSIRASRLADSTSIHTTFSNSKGKYRLAELPVGQYRLTFTLLGYKRSEATITIADHSAASLVMSLAPQVISGGDLVVTASRQEEKVNDAPASISVVNARQIAVTQSPTVSHLFAAVPGMDISQEGVFAESFSSRAANSVYSSDMYTMIDNRSLAVPGIGGYFGILMPISNFDIDHIEVVRGPGAALYGPGASEGVAHIITRSPFSSQGTSMSFAGGERQYIDAQLRHAMSLTDRLALKVSGTYRDVHDWEYTDTAEVSARNDIMGAVALGPRDTANFFDTVKVGHRRPDAKFYTLDGRVDYAIADNAMVMINGGTTKILQAVQMTSAAGAAQVDGWTMGYGQARMTVGDLFLEGYYQKVNTSNTYILRTGDPVAEASSATGFQAQHHYQFGNSELLTYGADYTSVNPTNSVAYGVNSGNVTSNIEGGYIQSKTTLVEKMLDLTLAARVDKQTEIDQMLFSPRAALVAHIGESDEVHTIRAMFNQTVTPPGVDAYYYDVNYRHNVFGLPVLTPGGPTIDLRIEGTQSSGMHFSMTDGSYTMYSPFASGGISVKSAVASLWPVIQSLAVQGLQSRVTDTNLIKQFMGIPAPPSDFVGGVLKMFDGTGFRPITSIQDVPQVKPQGHQVIELGYTAQLGSAVQIEIDGYRSHYDNYPATRQAITPNVFVDGPALQSYYSAIFRFGGLDSVSAATYSSMLVNGFTDSTGHVAGLAELPLGTVTPDGAKHPLDLLLGVPDYYGDVNYYGFDFMTALKVNDRLSVDAAFSMVSENQFTPDDTTREVIYLNIPKYKGSLGLHYTGLIDGLNADLKYRWYDAFTMRSGVAYFGDVPARTLVDLTLTYTDASFQDLQFTLAITNLFDYRHEEFVGAPYIGRFATLKAAYTLPSL